MVTPNSQNEDVVKRTKKHSFFSWTAQDAINPISIARAKGVYFWDADGKRYFDLSSQSMCVNIGHGNRRVIDAIKAQADELVFASMNAVTKVRAQLGEELARVTPGDLNKFFFTTGGTEANENAIKMARAYTGRHKIIARYPSYHGSTLGAMTLSGDYRRLANEPGIPGVVHIFDPYKYRNLLYREGDSDEVFTRCCLEQVDEVLKYEGPHTVAAIFIETIVGTNGILIPPDGYLQGLREMCTKYGILLICDEVMTGLGRTGKWFAVDHFNVVPDLMTMAKGLTSAYLPLGALAISDKIYDFYRDKVFYGGLTYSAHPMCLAASLAVLRVMEEDDIVGNSKRMGKVMSKLLADLKAKHISVGDTRSIGLFGCVELVKNRKTKEPMSSYTKCSPEIVKLSSFLKEQGVYNIIRGNILHTNPPLIVSEEELREVFEIIDKALEITDSFTEKS
ncbi:MAG: aminotransferase class III-fold pyridoxal phosphate-dependent enzyme [Parcubacteria group bacterium]|nr:aminotransferase class III-fold pyridoxal phosphate-dependent enzyme [Parcubacteria group bacterium]